MRLPASLAIATLLHASLLAGAPHLRRPQATAKAPVLVAIVSHPGPPVAAPLVQPVAAAPAKPAAPRPPRINAAPPSPSPPAASEKPAQSPEPPPVARAPVVAAAAPVAPAPGSEGIEGTGGHGGAPGGTGTSTGGTTGEGPAGGGSGTASGTGHADGDLRSLIAERIRSHRRYPSLARRRGIEGTVGLSLAIRPDGSVDVTVTRSADPMLDEAARAAARAAAPLPPIAGRIEVDLAFRLVDE